MSDLTDTQVNEACARFCGWEYTGLKWRKGDHWPRFSVPDYLHSPDAADELMRALEAGEDDVDIFSVAMPRGWLVRITHNGCRIEKECPTWKVALALAVASLQTEKERHGLPTTRPALR